MTGEELKELRKAGGLTRLIASKRTGYHPSLIQRIENDVQGAPSDYERKLRIAIVQEADARTTRALAAVGAAR